MTDKTMATDTADQAIRWAAWLARGVDQDRRMQKYTVALFVIVAVLLAAGLAMALAAR